jgi:hypothetical protein
MTKEEEAKLSWDMYREGVLTGDWVTVRATQSMLEALGYTPSFHVLLPHSGVSLLK